MSRDLLNGLDDALFLGAPPADLVPATRKARRPKVSRGTDAGRPKRYRCTYPDCAKQFSTGGHLTRHVKTFHSLERPFACGVGDCPARFSRHDNCRQHRKIHFRNSVGGEEGTPNLIESRPPKTLPEQRKGPESPSRVSLRARISRPKYVAESSSDTDEGEGESDALTEDTAVASPGSVKSKSKKALQKRTSDLPLGEVPTLPTPVDSGSPAPSDHSHETALFPTHPDVESAWQNIKHPAVSTGSPMGSYITVQHDQNPTTYEGPSLSSPVVRSSSDLSPQPPSLTFPGAVNEQHPMQFQFFQFPHLPLSHMFPVAYQGQQGYPHHTTSPESMFSTYQLPHQSQYFPIYSNALVSPTLSNVALQAGQAPFVNNTWPFGVTQQPDNYYGAGAGARSEFPETVRLEGWN
ncbi:hypothetical protein M427DRAFT_133405 [Gonapodya prolifera JEL478]|uniref:C2H2-type domain-containing protein n=1 Tax=Gonapodya prolifera (strain JEL478) TaxID=1344416 RepID=A0A139ALD8_GONPJ|nr:hypothetical protein M427DRAFT_133405 [Gonapodya prolifera JEL478]|eukprot:KXS17602.1 hypothetical protein M427DRAFT_133405 [Gonapodya prolifera JEL478]